MFVLQSQKFVSCFLITYFIPAYLPKSLAWPDWRDGYRCKWSENCDFEGHDLYSQQGPGEACSGICADDGSCTHFTWTGYNGGTCWLKRGDNLPAKRSNEYSVCGYVQRGSGGEISNQGTRSFTFKNNCRKTIWPAILNNPNVPAFPSTGFELAAGASTTLSTPSRWAGRIWGRTGCSSSSDRFSCQTGDCGSGQIGCNGNGGAPPTSLVEFTLQGHDGKDFYDVSLVDGFDLPVSIVPQGAAAGGCPSTSCAANINTACPSELQLVAGGVVVGCKSACLAFNEPQYCCSGAHSTPDTCPPTSYSRIFKDKCPQAYSYAYDDGTSTFTCTGANYLVTFCP